MRPWDSRPIERWVAVLLAIIDGTTASTKDVQSNACALRVSEKNQLAVWTAFRVVLHLCSTVLRAFFSRRTPHALTGPGAIGRVNDVLIIARRIDSIANKVDEIALMTGIRGVRTARDENMVISAVVGFQRQDFRSGAFANAVVGTLLRISKDR